MTGTNKITFAMHWKDYQKMKLKHLSFELPPNRKIERDVEGRFFLYEGTSKRRMVVRDEARKLLYGHRLNSKRNEFQFIHGFIGEQWFGHMEFYEYGKEFVRLGRNALSRDWKETFGISFPATHRSTAYNFLHGVELGLKAFILYKDERLLPSDLKWNRDQNIVNYGHNIPKLLIDARSKGLEVERTVVIPYGEHSSDEEDISALLPENTRLDEVFGKASSEDERRFDIAIGINFERYALKGTEYPISIYEGQEYYYLTSIASMAYTLFNEIRNTDGFFDRKRRDRHGEFEIWLQELLTQRKNYMLSEKEAVEKLAELDDFFDSCADLPGPDREPDWEEQREVIRQSKGSGTTNT